MKMGPSQQQPTSHNASFLIFTGQTSPHLLNHLRSLVLFHGIIFFKSDYKELRIDDPHTHANLSDSGARNYGNG